MAKESMIISNIRKVGHSTKHRNRCSLCGRPRGYMRIFGLCRLCFRRLAHKGELPGVYKASK